MAGCPRSAPAHRVPGCGDARLARSVTAGLALLPLSRGVSACSQLTEALCAGSPPTLRLWSDRVPADITFVPLGGCESAVGAQGFCLQTFPSTQDSGSLIRSGTRRGWAWGPRALLRDACQHLVLLLTRGFPRLLPYSLGTVASQEAQTKLL